MMLTWTRALAACVAVVGALAAPTGCQAPPGGTTPRPGTSPTPAPVSACQDVDSTCRVCVPSDVCPRRGM